MSQWQDQIRNHVVWQHLQALGPALDEAASKESIDPVSLDLIERVRTINTYSGKRTAALDPALVYQPALDSFASALQNTFAEVQAFLSDGQLGHLSNANAHASTALSHLSGLVAQPAPDELTGLSEAVAAYRNAMEKAVDVAARSVSQVQSEAAALTQKIADLTTEISNERARLTGLATDFQSQFSSAQDNRAKEFSDGQGNRLKEFSDAQSARQTRFDDLLTNYSQRLNDQDAESNKQREALHKQADDNLSALDLEYKVSAKTILDEILRHKADVEKLVGVIGNLGVTSGYEKAAESARKATWFWQTLTVLGFVVLIVFAFEAFLPAIQGEFRWQTFAGRVLLTFAVGVFAAYASAQGDRYMEAERRNRKLALELAALGPYLAPLPEDQQQAFRVAFGERTFGRDEQALNRRDRSPATPLDVVMKNMKNKGLRDFVVELIKAVRSG